MNVEQSRTLQLMHRLRDGFEGKKKELSSFWNGEDIIEKMAKNIQNRVENYNGDLLSARRDFTQALNIFGTLSINENTALSEKELYSFYKRMKKQFPENSMEELDIEAYHLNSLGLKDKVIKYIDKKIEEITISYLFTVARKEFGAEPFDKDKQLRQIRAVFHMLAGDHVAMDTGDGKTSVVIPVFSVTKALLSKLDRPSPTLFLSGAEEKTTKEIREKVQEYAKHVNVAINETGQPEVKKALSWKLSLAAMAPDYQDNSVTDPLLKKLNSPIPSIQWAKNLGANIGFIPHSDMVFQTTGQYTDQVDRFYPLMNSTNGLIERQQILKKINAGFEKTLPTFIVDEVHLLRNPFTTETGRLPAEKIKINLAQPEIRDGLCQYLTLRLFHDEFLTENKANYVERVGGEGQLTEKGRKRASQLIREWFNQIEEWQNWKSDTPDIVRRIKKIINQEIKPNFETDRRFSSHKLINYFQEFIDFNITNEDLQEERKSYRRQNLPYSGLFKSITDQKIIGLLDGYLETIGSIEQGVDYLTPQLLRDHLRGVALPSHRFSSDINFFLSALEGKPYLSEKRSLDYDINFYTWLALVNRGNFIALSNDLYYTDPETGKRVLSTMGKVLETYTNGKVVDLSPKKTGKERLPIPNPLIVENYPALVEKISQDVLSGKRPEMLVCWDETTAKEIYDKLKNQGKKVVLIDSQTDDNMADLYHNQFANYGVDILLTTGRKSFAADFKDKNGRFTDFRVSVVNPETIFQIAQAFGRRRLSKKAEDFSIYFEKENLLVLASSVLKKEHELPFFSSILGKADPLYKELTDLVEKQELDEKQKIRLKTIIIEVLRRSQNQVDGDWERMVENEVTFIQDIAPKIKEGKKEIFYADLRNTNSSIRQIIEQQIEEKTRKYRLSKTVTNKLRKIAMNTALQSFAQVDEGLVQDFFNDTALVSFNPALGKDKVVRKDLIIRQFEKRIDEVYKNLWKDSLEPGSFYIEQVLKNQIDQELISYAEILKQLPTILKRQELKTSQVEDFYFLYAPPIEAANNKTLPKTTVQEIVIAPHGQKIGIKTKNGKTSKYLASQTGQSWLLTNDEAFERRLEVLNQLQQNYFQGKKYIDIYYQGQGATSMFLRVVLKK